MAPEFRSRASSQPASDNPESLFNDLPRTRDRVPSLWAHQADLLRRYSSDHADSPDVALELPTGAGKTLPALLIAEWRRTALQQRVAYCAPNHQLAHQVASQARRQGIEPVTLVGSHHDWNLADATSYDSAHAVAITTYSTVFNSNPALVQPQTIIFDDAHAAEQYVASAWSVPIDRREQPVLYEGLLEAISPALSELVHQRLVSRDPDPTLLRDVRLLQASALKEQARQIDGVLAAAEGDIRFRYTMIRENLERCLLYYSWSGFLLRPYVPPTGRHREFADAEQRLYVSATLGEGGELERAFGRAPIARLPLPEGWDRRGSGRRFFIFPELTPDADPRALAKSAAERSNKALIIAPSGSKLEESLETLVPNGWPLFSKRDVERSLSSFAEADRGVLALANRYDGIDLADDSCRITILDGAPRGEHLQERFFVGSLRAGRVIEERLRTRVIQGAGRCTRGLTDFSLVIVLGDELTRFLSRQEVRRALRPEVQAEITFGLDNSIVDSAELDEYVESFLNQDDGWQDGAEPIIADLAREAEIVLPIGTDALAASVEEEVRAWEKAWEGDLVAASRIATDLCRHLTDEPLQSYRAFWLYLGAVWLKEAAEIARDEEMALNARSLLRKAHGAGSGTWLKETAPLPAANEELKPIDETAVQNIAGSPLRRSSISEWAEHAEKLVQDLSGRESTAYERGLTSLGALLGADSFKPEGKGRADSVWLFGNHWWLTLEAKSEAKTSGLVSLENVRQANTQLQSLGADRGHDIPNGSLSLIVTPKQLTDPDAAQAAVRHLYLCSPEEILELARDAIDAWRQIRLRARGLDEAEVRAVVRQELAERHCTPTHMKERLTAQPVSG